MVNGRTDRTFIHHSLITIHNPNPMKSPALLLLVSSLALAADPPEPKFTAVTLDAKIQIGYGLAIADVDGDKAPDVLLADKRQIVWYRNPGPAKAREPGAWTKHLIAENLTEKDNVCLAAQDLDGDGKCELAVGAEWNPGDTEKSGAVFYLIPPADRTQRWEPVKFPSVEPTTHRMRWIKVAQASGLRPPDGSQAGGLSYSWGLVVVPLHGRGNKNGEGAPVKVLCYNKPADPKGEWKTEVIDESMHLTHNVEVHNFDKSPESFVLIAGREGLLQVSRYGGEWLTEASLLKIDAKAVPKFRGAGEVRLGTLPLDANFSNGPFPFISSVEPMHGHELCIYLPIPVQAGIDSVGYRGHQRFVLTDKLIEGHALACGDLLGVKSDQIVVGWRGNPARPDNTFGIHLWTPLDRYGGKWRDSAVDDGGMACEDLQLADLDGDGRPDIAASGRATRNVKLYFNDTPR